LAAFDHREPVPYDFTGNSTTFFLEGTGTWLLILNDIQKVDFHNFGTLVGRGCGGRPLKDEEEEK
jgi:hypothetical protein